MARLARIAVFPIKSLDPVACDTARIVENGGLEHDREYAMVDADDRYINGKRTPKVHRIRSTFDPGFSAVTLHREDVGGAERFDLETDRESAESWLSSQFDPPVQLKRETAGGFPDDTTLSGPTLISTGTLREVASWFPDIGVEELRLRLRANLEIDGVPPFWEDRLFADHDHLVAFEIGDVLFEGINPCQRCVVPTRDPHTGEAHDEFQRVFVEKREEMLPEWTDSDRFDHFFRLMLNTQVPESAWGAELAVGDEVEILGERPVEERSESA
ncbi:MOSC domain-containing protein [Halococcus saccharolyticus]|uniref:MOSC domain-containing protein beta barrel domain-containing protein n=1 Tax=Halococcus saccharolyticus DSM 5350 TaxID=1227455 RepID=M0MG58_9EURY|nr:MOSC N-terminal beta barrel domain-containing protein [Halococcus saccharolyticus]EMA44712.1 MOSC domain-containing protein beta barrel domain-containing protein [Halococcus saccharolyticus DSM 5350]